MDFQRIAARIAAGTPSWIRWFHVSPWDLGSTTVLQPRVPEITNTDWNGEDNTTPRVCLAPTVEKALAARIGNHDPDYHNSEDDEGVYIYGVGRIDTFTPNSKGVPEQDGNPYGMSWGWIEYAKFKGLDPKSKKDYSETVKNCVPDADITGEVWSLKPVRMTKVGRYRKGRVFWNVRKDSEDDHD